MRKRHLKKERSKDVELDITTFLNLMVVLIPFLLLNAVFTQVAVLQVNLPGPGSAAEAQAAKALTLEVAIYRDRFLVMDRNSGPLKEIQHTATGPDYTGLTRYLREVKTDHANTTEATLLLEAETPYDQLVQTMDAVRVYEEKVNQIAIKGALFPDIGIGDAPADPRHSVGGAT